MTCRIALMIALAFAPVVLADAPFQDASYADTLKKAKKQDKLVMIDFYTTWCGPCKMLDKNTWSDKKVRAWLDKHAICLKVDAEADRKLAAKFAVTAYPTVIFVKPDGSVLDRFVGYLDPKGFLTAATNAVSGNDTLTRAKKAMKAADEHDPVARMRYAESLAQMGRYDDALKELLWCFDHGVEYAPDFAQARSSVLLGDIARLCRVSPAAVKAMQTRRAAAASQLRDFIAGKTLKEKKSKVKGITGLVDRLIDNTPAVVTVAVDVAALNSLFGQSEKTITFYDKLKDCDRAHSNDARAALFPYIANDLLGAHRYADVVRDGDPVRSTAQAVQMFNMTKANVGDENDGRVKIFLSRARVQTIKRIASYYEACVGAHRPELAEQVKEKMLGFETSVLVYEELIVHAAKAKRFDVIPTLGEDAKRHLDAKDAETIGHRVRANLSTPAAKAAMAKDKDASNSAS